MVQKKQLLVLPVLIILICIIFYPILFQGKVFSSPDSLNPKAAAMILNKTQEETGEYPLWQPWIFSGMPTAESFTNTGNLYFPQYLFKLLHIPVSIIHLLHFLLAGVGVYILLRYLKISQYVAIFGASSFMLMPYLVTMEVFGHGSQAMTAAYIPWAFWAGLRLFDNRKILDAGLLALLLGLQLQRAHVQIAYYTWMLIGALFLFKIVVYLLESSTRQDAVKISLLFIISIVFAIGLSAIVYLPSLQYSAESIRSVGQAGSASFDYATSWSFHPKEMLTFLIPSAFGFGGQTYWGAMPFTDYPNYMGIIILFLAFVAFIKNKNNLVWFLGATSILALFIAFGRHFSVLYRLFYNFAPYFNKFRIPSMILIIVQFNTVVLAAIGLEKIINLGWKEIPKWFWWSTGILGAIAIILLLGSGIIQGIVSSGFTPPRSQDPRYINLINDLRWRLWYKDAWLFIVFIIASFTALYLLFKGKINKLIFIVLIGSIAIIDLAIVDQKIVQPAEGSGRVSQLVSSKALKRYFTQDAVTAYLSKIVGKYRVYPIGNLFGESRLQAFGIESVGGYHPAKLAIYNLFLQNTNNISTLPLMRMMNVHYILSPQIINHPELNQVFNENMQSSSGRIPIWIYEIENYMDRAWFVQNIEVEEEDKIWKKLMEDSFDPLNNAYVTDKDVPGISGTGQVLSEEYAPNYIKIEVDTDNNSFMVVSEVFYPLRWKAFIDGESIKTFKTNGILRGLIVPTGIHTIEFKYDRSIFNLGIQISLISIVLIFGVIGIGYFKNKK